MTEIETKIEKARLDLENLLRQKMIQDRQEAEMTETQKLAIKLHDTLCTQNHTDGCGWFYEIKDGIHSWNGTHGRWLDKAIKFARICDHDRVSINDAFRVINAVKEIQ